MKMSLEPSVSAHASANDRKIRRPVLGHGDVGGERRAAEGAQVEGDDLVPGDAEGGGHAPGRLELGRVALAIPEGEGVDREPAFGVSGMAALHSMIERR